MDETWRNPVSHKGEPLSSKVWVSNLGNVKVDDGLPLTISWRKYPDRSHLLYKTASWKEDGKRTKVAVVAQVGRLFKPGWTKDAKYLFLDCDPFNCSCDNIEMVSDEEFEARFDREAEERIGMETVERIEEAKKRLSIERDDATKARAEAKRIRKRDEGRARRAIERKRKEEEKERLRLEKKKAKEERKQAKEAERRSKREKAKREREAKKEERRLADERRRKERALDNQRRTEERRIASEVRRKEKAIADERRREERERAKQAERERKKAEKEERRKSSSFWVDNAEMMDEIRKSKNRGKITDRLGEIIMKIANGVSMSPKFNRYTNREDLEGDAILLLTQNILKFDPEKSSNAHAYATAIAMNAIIESLNAAKKKDWGLKWRLLHEYATCHPEASKLASEWTLSESEEKRITEEMNKSREERAKGMAAMKALTMVWEQGKSHEEAAKANGLDKEFLKRVKYGAVRPEIRNRWLSERDLEHPPIPTRRRLTDEEATAMLERYFVGKDTMQKIADEMGFNISTVSLVVNGINRPKVKEAWLSTKPEGFVLEYPGRVNQISKETAMDIFERYYVNKVAVRKIAEETGFSAVSIAYLVNGERKPHLFKQWLATKPQGFVPKPPKKKGRPRKKRIER